MEHLNGRLRGVLGHKEGIEEMGEDNESDSMSTDDEDDDKAETSDMELDINVNKIPLGLCTYDLAHLHTN